MTDLTIKPYDYQIEDMQFLLEHKKAALLHSPGVGKTLGVLLALTYVLETEGGRALVIVPPILLDTWQDKFKEYFKSDLSSVIYRGTISQRAKIDLMNHRIVFISFGLIQRDYDKLKKIQWSYLVIDETKYIKNGEVKRSSKTKMMNKFGVVQALSSRIKYLALMNGTPITKSPADLFHIIQLLNPNIYVSKKNFLKIHAIYKANNDGYPMIVGWRRLDVLNSLLAKYTRRLIKEDVLDLPKKQLIVKQFSLDPIHQRRLKELWDYGFLELDEDAIYLEGMGLMMQVRRAMIDTSLVGLNNKSEYFTALDDLLTDLGNEQVIIFAHFHTTIEKLKGFLDGKGIKFTEITGRVSSAEKEKAVDLFKKNGCQVLVANAKSAGVGLDFYNCHNGIFFELDYEVDSFWQGQDRMHRIGQIENVNIYVFVARDTPAVSLFRAVKTNINYVEEVLKGKEDSSIFWNNKITVEEELAWKKLS